MSCLKRFIGLIILLGIVGCGKNVEEIKDQRNQLAKKSRDIVIGVAWTDIGSHDPLMRGIDLAVAEVNKKGGVLLENTGEKKRLKIRKKQVMEYTSLSERQAKKNARRVALSLATQPDITAVIGHRASSLAISTSIVYEDYGVIFFPPVATNLMLTHHLFQYTFRVIPNNKKTAFKLANYCFDMGYRKMIVVYSRTTYSEELANAFIEGAQDDKHQLDILGRYSFFPVKPQENRDFSKIIAEIRKAGYLNAIFLSSDVDSGIAFIKQSRQMAIKVPFVGGESFDTDQFKKEIGTYGEGFLVPTIYSERTDNAKQFKEQFQKQYNGNKPSRLAALGYDIVKLLVHTIQKSGNVAPAKIASYLRHMGAWDGGATGTYDFNDEGELEDKTIYLKMLCQQDFYTLPEKNMLQLITQLNNPEYLANNAAEAACLKLFKDLIIIDQDQDGIADKADQCPNNTKEEMAQGIIDQIDNPKIGCPRDDDNDEVPNYLDKCPLTTEEMRQAIIDEHGCPEDLDQDEVPDYQDNCPETPLGLEVDEQGCAKKQESEHFIIEGNNFTRGQLHLQSQTQEELTQFIEQLVDKLTDDLVENIEVVGHTDSRGSEEQNQALSEQRAQSVADYLTSQGIPLKLMTIIGQGKNKPIASNDTKQGREKNRRVEINITLFKEKLTVPKIIEE